MFRHATPFYIEGIFRYKMNEKIHAVPFESLHRHLKGVIERYAFFFTRRRQYVEDTAQEIFLRLWLRWPRLGELTTDELEDYIYIMTRNYLIDEQKLVKKEESISAIIRTAFLNAAGMMRRSLKTVTLYTKQQ